jgi:hypothetical protein
MLSFETIKKFSIANSLKEKPFYAEDYGMNGGMIQALSQYELIKPTGNTKEAFIPMNTFYDTRYLRVEAHEWKVNSDKVELYIDELIDKAALIDSMIDLLLFGKTWEE